MCHFVMYLKNCLLKILRQASILVLLGYQYEQMDKQYTRSAHIYFILYFQVFYHQKKQALQNVEKQWPHSVLSFSFHSIHYYSIPA